jgi:aminoglycoside phosphotransferase (APT) family kinase protein
MLMHEGQLEVSPATVAALVAAQLPQWSSLPVRAVTSDGTENALFRLGDDVVLRFPLQVRSREALVREQDNARLIAAHVRLTVPEPLAIGAPGPGYPGPWAAYRWIGGQPVVDDLPEPAVLDLADFVREVRAIDPAGRTGTGRGRSGQLAAYSPGVTEALGRSRHLVDVDRVAALWRSCLAAPAHRDADVWLHADLMPGNLLLDGLRLAAVLDLGSVCLGDPAVDLMPAWNTMTSSSRTAYRQALAPDDATWRRGMGWAIAQASLALPYYEHTNPVMAATARRTLAAVLG